MQRCGGRLGSCHITLQRVKLSHRLLALNVSGTLRQQKHGPQPTFRPFVSVSKPYHQPRRSPFAVLGLPPTATTDQIKSSFRKLALRYHPDLRTNSNPEEEDDHQKMAEILEAYERLMDRDYSMLLTPGNSQLAASCEVLTLQEIRDDSRFDVHAIWMRYADDDDNDGDVGCNNNFDTTTDEMVRNTENGCGDALHSALSISIHPDSSVSDLKQDLLQAYQDIWNIQSRRMDRYGLAIGWELALPQVQNDGSTYLLTLGNHDFVKHHYGIQSNTLLYAVIQKHGSDVD